MKNKEIKCVCVGGGGEKKGKQWTFLEFDGCNSYEALFWFTCRSRRATGWQG